MQVPYENQYEPTEVERQTWDRHQSAMRARVAAGVDSKQALAAIRGPHWKWT